MYTTKEKVLFILETAGNLTEQEVQAIHMVCPEVRSYPPHHSIWQRDRLSSKLANRAQRSEPPADSSPADPEEVLAALIKRIKAAKELTSSRPCEGDSFGNRHGVAPSPQMVDHLVSFIPRLDALARRKYRQEVLEEPRKQREPAQRPDSFSLEGVSIIMLFGVIPEREYREFVHCVLTYEERWRPLNYNELLRAVGAGYGKVAHAMTRSNLSFDQIRAILVSLTRFASRQSANIAYVTSGRLQRLLNRLGELRQAEECPLLRPRRR